MTRQTISIRMVLLLLALQLGCGSKEGPPPPRQLRARLYLPAGPIRPLLQSWGMVGLQLDWQPAGGAERIRILRLTSGRLDAPDELDVVAGRTTHWQSVVAAMLPPPLYEVRSVNADGVESSPADSGLVPLPLVLTAEALIDPPAPGHCRLAAPATAVALDPQTGLWVATDGAGLRRFDVVQHRWVSWDRSVGLLSDRIRALTVAKDRVRIATDSGLQELHSAEGRVVSDWAVADLSLERDLAMAATGQTLWLAGAAGMRRFATPANRLAALCPATDPARFGLDSMATPGEIAEWNSFQSIVGLTACPLIARSLLQAPNGDLWVILQDGILLQRQSATTTWLRHPTPLNAPLPPVGKGFVHLAADGQGGLWLGYGSQLFRRDPLDGRWVNVFGLLSPDSPRPQQLLDFAVSPGGHAWILDSKALWLRDPAAVAWRSLPRPSAAVAGTLVADAKGNAWLGTQEGGLLRMEAATAAVEPFDCGGQPLTLAVDLEVEADGSLWVATPRGLVRRDPRSGTWQRFDSEAGLPSSDVRALAADERGNLWVATARGLAIRPAGLGLFTRQGPNDPAWSDGSLATVLATAGRVWIGGTPGAAWLDVDHGRWQVLTNAQGLPPGAVRRIFPSGNGDIWLTSEAATVRWDTKAQKLVAGSPLDGTAIGDGLLCSGKAGSIERRADRLVLHRSGLPAGSDLILGMDNRIQARDIHACALAPDGTVLLAANGGRLLRGLPGSANVETLAPVIAGATEISIRHMILDSEQTLWMIAEPFGLMASPRIIWRP